MTYDGSPFLMVLTIAWMAYWARAAGGNALSAWLNNLPVDISWLCEVLVVLPIAYASFLMFGGGWMFSLAAIWSYFAWQTGHAVAMNMGRLPETAQSGRKAKLSFIVDPICKAFGWGLGEAKYCWLFMGLKGLFIGLPLGVWALLLAILFPAAYEIGHRMPNARFKTFFPETMSGAAAGCTIAAAFFI